jgi:hypothetical protein
VTLFLSFLESLENILGKYSDLVAVSLCVFGKAKHISFRSGTHSRFVLTSNKTHSNKLRWCDCEGKMRSPYLYSAHLVILVVFRSFVDRSLTGVAWKDMTPK